MSRQIERAQRKVEAHNFDIRKNLLEFDDVANDQRKFVYSWRNQLMVAEDVANVIRGLAPRNLVNKEVLEAVNQAGGEG